MRLPFVIIIIFISSYDMFISIEIELDVLLGTGYTALCVVRWCVVREHCRLIICGKCIERWKWKEVDILAHRRKLRELEEEA